MVNLPVLTKGAQSTAEIAVSVFDIITSIAGIPSFGNLAIGIMNKRVEAAQEILREAIREGNLDLITAEQYEELVPMGYKFFEAAKQGEQKHILMVLAQIVSDKAQNIELDAQEFLRISRRIEGLSKGELGILVRIHEHFRNQTEPTKISRQNLIKIIDADVGYELDLILADFVSRGLLISSPSETIDDIGPNYSFSPVLDVVVSSALKARVEL